MSMSRKNRIKLQLEILSPQILNLIDDSNLHKNHPGSTNEPETHFTLQIASKKLNNLSLIQQHRAINNLLKEEFKTGLHALKIEIIT